MFRSLRFRLPAFYLAGVALAGIVTTVIAVQLFQDHVRSQSLAELKREARGLSSLYARQAISSIDEGRSAPDFAGRELEKATGARLYYVGAPVFFRHGSGLRELSRSQVGNEWQTLIDGKKVTTFEFTPPGEAKTFLAVGQPLVLEGQNFGALVVARKKTDLTQGWFSLFELLLVALGVGLLVAAGLAWYLSRRIATPVLALSKAADGIAKGRYDVDIPDVRGTDEISHLSERFREMAARLAEAEEQRAELPDVRLPRAADAADRDPGPCRGPPGRADHRPRDGGGVAECRRRGGGAARAARRRRSRPRQARRAPVHGAARGGGHGAPGRAGVRNLRRGGETPARSTTAATATVRR